MSRPQPVAQPGRVYLIGAGPGDADLITVKGYRYLQQADAVIYDRLANNSLLELVPPHCKLVYAGKRKHMHAMRQPQIQACMISLARKGLRVVRLKGGDPFIFGRGGEEVAALRAADVPWEVVPGVTAASGAGAAAGLPLTHRDHAQALTLITAHRRHGRLEIDWPLVMRARQTVVFYMAFSVLPQLVAGLLQRGQPGGTGFSVVSNATSAGQQVIHSSLAEILQHPRLAQMTAPALLIMHGLDAETYQLPDVVFRCARMEWLDEEGLKPSARGSA